jgi:hypothetical protein
MKKTRSRKSRDTVPLTLSLPVLGPPMVHQMPDIKAVMGREVRVLCPASGYPLENILWSKGESGQRLPAREHSLVQR